MADIEWEVRGLHELIVKFQAAPSNIQARILSTLNVQMGLLKDEVQRRIRELFQTPDRMASTVTDSVTAQGPNTVVGSVKASGLPYLAIQEYGGTVQTPEITPVNAKVLAFFLDKRLNFSSLFTNEASIKIFTMKTKAHPTTLPERSYMRSSLARRKASILDSLRDAATKAL